MSARRTYGDPCGIARALDVIGDRWALLIVRELLLGPKRFTDLRRGLPHIGPDVLSQRLRELEEAGVVQRDDLPPPAASRVYALTQWGAGLESVLTSLGRWGSRAEFPAGHGPLGIDALVIALKSLFSPGAGGRLRGTYELRLGGQTFRARVADGELELERGEAGDADATIAAEPGSLQAVLWHGRDVRSVVHSGELTLSGDRRAAERFLKAFPLPG